jgi:hypothetical protein
MRTLIITIALNSEERAGGTGTWRRERNLNDLRFWTAWSGLMSRFASHETTEWPKNAGVAMGMQRL